MKQKTNKYRIQTRLYTHRKQQTHTQTHTLIHAYDTKKIKKTTIIRIILFIECK